MAVLDYTGSLLVEIDICKSLSCHLHGHNVHGLAVRGPGRFGMDHTGTPMFAGRGSRGFGGRMEGPGTGGLGPSGMRAGRGFGPRAFEGPEGSGGGMGQGLGSPRQPAIDPAVLERRKKSITARLQRQIRALQISGDLVDEAVLQRVAELEEKGGQASSHQHEGEPGGPAADLAGMYMYKVLGADDRERLPMCQQRFDQTQAFEYCLQLYQAVPEVRMSKFGHFIVH